MGADVQLYQGPIVVTVAYLLVYYGLILRVAQVKTVLAREYDARGEKFDRYFGGDRVMLAADRQQLNTLEHMTPFLALLWLNAVFVGPLSASIAGGIYVLARGAYPFVMGAKLGRGVRGTIMMATGPGYLVLVWYLGALTYALLTAG